MQERYIKHLYNRIGFGIDPNKLKQLSILTKQQIVDEIFAESQINTPLLIDTPFFDKIKSYDLKERSVKLEFQRKSTRKVKDFGVAWFERLKKPSEILREKMTLFWSNHFVCKSNNIIFMQPYNNTLRKNALGNFIDFTKAISKEPAMLAYLNNNQNKRSSPNENFARELMELFTLGHGNYTEKDITESAKAFTGYSNNFSGDFSIRTKHQDQSEKTFFGKKGFFIGDDIIDMIVSQKQCARFITQKIYSYFVNENINEYHIDLMTDVFYPNYDIEHLMKFVLLSDWFYNEENIATKIKSPIEVLVGIHKVVPYKMLRKNQLIIIQRLLGQVLVDPPNVAGWKTGRNWIDSNTLVMRLRVASILLNQEQITFSDLGNEEALIADLKDRKLEEKTIVKTKTDWESFMKVYGDLSKNELAEFLITSKLAPKTQELLFSNIDMPLKEFCIQLMSLPEYQLC